MRRHGRRAAHAVAGGSCGGMTVEDERGKAWWGEPRAQRLISMRYCAARVVPHGRLTHTRDRVAPLEFFYSYECIARSPMPPTCCASRRARRE